MSSPLRHYEIMLHGEEGLTTIIINAEAAMLDHGAVVFSRDRRMVAGFDLSSIVGWQEIEPEETGH